MARRSTPPKPWGLYDRGLIAPGYRADLNVIDYDALKLASPTVAFDLPAGGRRLIQRASGYVATIVGGHATYRDGGADRRPPRTAASRVPERAERSGGGVDRRDRGGGLRPRGS